MPQYWLFKSEPDVYSIDQLAAEKQQITRWDGIRNYQARNFLRDQVKVGDRVFFYHSRCKVPGIIGIAEVVKASYPDPAQFDPKHNYYDSKARVDKPRWYSVDVKLVEKFSAVIPLQLLKQQPALENMVLLKQGRLSIQPVAADEWKAILKLKEK